MARLPLALLLFAVTVGLGQTPTPLVTPSAPAPTAPTPLSAVQQWLATMDAQWQPIFARDVAGRFDTEIAELRRQYVATLDANIAKATTAGNLDLTLLLRKERERFLAAKDLPPTDDAADPPLLKALRAPVRTQAARMEADRAARARALHGRYDQLLAQSQVQLTQKQRLEDAVAVKTRREEIARAWLGEAEAASVAKAENGKIAAAPVSIASPTPPLATGSEALEAFFVGKTWVSPAGTAYTFEPHGDGHTQVDRIKWHHLGSGVVEVELPGKPKNNTRYFKFVSATEAYYNGDRRDITKPVHLQ